MSKTYWLVSSNSIPTPEKKDKTLVLHGVNSYDIQELKPINGNSKIFILSDTTLDNISQKNYPFLFKLSLKNKLNLCIKVWQMFDRNLKISIITIAIYLILFLFIAAYCPPEWSIYTAIISTLITFVSCFFPIFINDKRSGSWAIIALSIGLGILIGEVYFYFEKYFIVNPFLNKDRIGNSLTALTMIFTFISSIKSTISSFIYEIRSTMI